MPYTPPSYEKLSQNITELAAYFNVVSARYISPNYEALRKNPSELANLYREKVSAKNNLFFTAAPDEKRLSQIMCISELIESLPLVIEDESKRQYAQTLILGAMFYRYLRIRHSYSGISSYVMGDASNSALFVSLAKILGVTEQNPLDALTIKTACETYRDYLRQEGVAARFAYIQKDATFFSKLDAQIELSKKPAEVTLVQLNYLNALPLKSTASVIKEVEAILLAALQSLKSALIASELKQFTQEQLKTVLISCALPAWVNDYCFSLFPALRLVEKANIDELIERLEERLNVHNQYALLGACLFGYSKISDTMPFAKRVLEKALDISAVNLLDNKTRELAMTAFDNLINLEQMQRLDYRIWGGYDALVKELELFHEAINSDSSSSAEGSKLVVAP